MVEIKIFITNLGKRVNGMNYSKWFTLPTSYEEIAEEIELEEQDEYLIQEYEAPFTINEQDSIDHLNYLAELFEEHASSPVIDYIGELVSDGYYGSVEEALESIDDVVVYEGCSNMTDVAYDVAEASGLFANATDLLQRYFNFQAFGRDLAIEGNYYVANGMVFDLGI